MVPQRHDHVLILGVNYLTWCKRLGRCDYGFLRWEISLDYPGKAQRNHKVLMRRKQKGQLVKGIRLPGKGTHKNLESLGFQPEIPHPPHQSGSANCWPGVSGEHGGDPEGDRVCGDRRRSKASGSLLHSVSLGPEWSPWEPPPSAWLPLRGPRCLDSDFRWQNVPSAAVSRGHQ